MTITLTPALEKVVLQQAHEQGTTPEAIVLNAIREKLGLGLSELAPNFEPRDDWERRLLSVGTPCGVSVSDEALSSEGLYDQ
jgi:hypothetical protein